MFIRRSTGTVTITDTYNACSKSQNFEILQAPAVNVSLTKTDVTCFGKNDGTMTAVVNGGVGPFSYNWSTTLHTETITNLVPGTYSVTVTDDNQCTARATASIVEPTRFLYTISASVAELKPQSQLPQLAEPNHTHTNGTMAQLAYSTE